MPKFKQFTNIQIRAKSSSTIGSCFNDDGMNVGCSLGTVHQSQTACTGAGGTWTTYTKATCIAKNTSGTPSTIYSWIGNRYNDFSITEIVHIDLEKVQRFEAQFDKIAGTIMSGYTHVVTEKGTYTIEKSLEDFMGIMAVEVPE